jgi:tetratricopeptide (TPR) repeat protein
VYNGLGNVYYEQKKYDKAIEVYKQAISINPNLVQVYNGLGNVYYEQKKYEEAIEVYKQAIAINPNLVQAFNGLGNVYYEQKKYEEAIEVYKQAIGINPNLVQVYNGLGNVYFEQKKYEEAIEVFNQALVVDSKYALVYYHRGINYENLKNYSEALANFEKYNGLVFNNSSYLKLFVQHKIVELKKLIKNSDYSKISELIIKIKDLLLFKDPCVTHYTGITAAKFMILNDSKLRLSEGAFLNDTSEGRELFKFLPSLTETTTTNDTVALPFSPKPFIGSFVAETKHDDLTLWRMYGKENKEEATGCAITLDRNMLLQNLKSDLTGDEKTDSPKIEDEEFSFYSVAYIQRGQPHTFVVPGAEKQVEKELNQYMNELTTLVEKFKNKEDADISSLLELLNSIAYLFKSAEYYYEHELRLIVKGIGFPKQILKESQPPRVYIDLVLIPPLIRKITLGPKVDRAEEWASAFYYKLDAEGHHPEIMISHLPFK